MNHLHTTLTKQTSIRAHLTTSMVLLSVTVPR